MKHLIKKKKQKFRDFAQTSALRRIADILFIRFIVILTVNLSGSTRQLIVSRS